jgi:hypothetical protein
MLRRLLVGVVVIATFASLGSFSRTPNAVQASPANQSISLTIVDHKDDGTDEARVEFGKGEGKVWALMDGVPAGANLSYILRLNGWDYKWGKLGCCKDGGGSFAFPVFRKDGVSIPGGAYELLVYDGDMELGRTGFGVNGGKGSDNDNDHN